MRILTLALAIALAGIDAMAIDLQALWDRADPELTERRLRDAMPAATVDERRILQTQVARTYGLRRQFDRARAILAELEPALGEASAEARARYFLELGRTYASATHREAERTDANCAAARGHFLEAREIAMAAKLDDLAIDALHMMPFAERDPAAQLAWNEKAIAFMEASTQPEARRWEASLRNNVGYARHQMGDYAEALRQFGLSRAAHARAGRERQVRVADWMIAWTYRAQKRHDDARALLHDLERRWEAAGEVDPHVFAELELVYRALGNEERAASYSARAKAARK